LEREFCHLPDLMLVTWRYRFRNSLMDRFDPRARWIFSLIFLISITMFWDARFLLFFFIIGFAWYFSGRATWDETKRGWKLVGFLLFVMIVINTIITGGGAGGVVPPGGLKVWPQGFTIPFFNYYFHFGLTYERIWFAICQFLRIGGISAIFLIIPYTMDPRVYGVTFRGLGLPDSFAYSMELAFRYVPTLARDFGTTFDAQRARGYEIDRVKGGIVKQIIRIAPLIVPVTMNSILTGEDVTNAMDLRCFGTNPRTWLTKLTFHWQDFSLIAFSLLLLLGGIITKYGLHIGNFWVPDFWLQLAGS
jgi:energy-coupling factor transport system permease protein